MLRPLLGSLMRTSPLRAVCRTRRSGSTASAIGSPGKSFRVTFWKSGSGGTAAAAGVPNPVIVLVTRAAAAAAVASRRISEPQGFEILVADAGGVQGLL